MRRASCELLHDHAISYEYVALLFHIRNDGWVGVVGL